MKKPHATYSILIIIFLVIIFRNNSASLNKKTITLARKSSHSIKIIDTTFFNHNKTNNNNSCSSLLKYIDDNQSFSIFLNKLKQKYPQSNFISNVKNIELTLPTNETRRIQFITQTNQDNKIKQTVKWYKVDHNGFPFLTTFTSKTDLKEIFLNSKIHWEKESGTIIIPETNNRLIVEIENSKLTYLEWYLDNSFNICNFENNQMRCDCRSST